MKKSEHPIELHALDRATSYQLPEKPEDFRSFLTGLQLNSYCRQAVGGGSHLTRKTIRTYRSENPGRLLPWQGFGILYTHNHK